jgi:TonB family protein
VRRHLGSVGGTAGAGSTRFAAGQGRAAGANGRRRALRYPRFDAGRPDAAEYPKNALNANGSVVLELLVGADGYVKDAKVVKSTPAGVFDQAAIDAALTWYVSPESRERGANRGAPAHAGRLHRSGEEVIDAAAAPTARRAAA